ncbi:MAG: protein kinase [Proteobacteria bacterium]|nr:protein kinase [Pseudomonadota bacterium]
MLKRGSVIVDRYRLESQIGDGGMGCVWDATQLSLERPVAIKFLYTHGSNAELQAKRFLREARLAAAIEHRNVVDILDFGVSEWGQPFMVMSLLQGETLADRMDREPALSVDELVRVAGLALRGLAAVHDAGIVHRDLKPENVFLVDAPDGAYPKLLDFGISRSMIAEEGDDGQRRKTHRSPLTTREGVIVGTPQYMSPEQARGLRRIDARSDIYAMGVILYEALTGRLPFDSENIGDLILMIVTGHAEPIGAMRPEIGSALCHVVTRAMQRRPEDRFQTAIQMQQALLDAAEGTTDAGIVHTLSILPRPMRSTFPAKVEVPLIPTLPDLTGPGGPGDSHFGALRSSASSRNATTPLDPAQTLETGTEDDIVTQPIPRPDLDSHPRDPLVDVLAKRLKPLPAYLRGHFAHLASAPQLRSQRAAAALLLVAGVALLALAALRGPAADEASASQRAAHSEQATAPRPAVALSATTGRQGTTSHPAQPQSAAPENVVAKAPRPTPSRSEAPDTQAAAATEAPEDQAQDTPPPWELGILPQAPLAVSDDPAPAPTATPTVATRTTPPARDPRPNRKRRYRKRSNTKLLRKLDY